LSPERERAGAAVRAGAARIVARVVRERVAVDDALEAGPSFPGRDASLLAALVFGALRWHYRLEWQTARLLSRPLKARQDELAALLRIGLLQLQHFRIPEHAAVSATVDAAAELGLRGAAGLVNAVLRRYQREREALDTQIAAYDEAAFSHPRWLVDTLRRERPDEWRAILEANNAAAPMWLRVNSRRLPRAEYLERLAAAGLGARPSPEVATAVVLDEPQPVVALPGFAAGDVSVQDVAAQRAVEFLDLRPGQRVLDACAAPGGKTGHILEACDVAEVWAVDRAARLPLVRSNLERLGLSAKLVAGDATRPADWWDGSRFDRILLDAPCSAVGVIRRHPDIKLRRRPEDVAAVVRLQAELLRGLWPLLAPGGRLVYATCTLLMQENDAQIGTFLAADHGREPVPQLVGTPRQTLPGEALGDAFYYACMTKPDGVPSPSVSPTQQ
jgi:16S rRNA (cytosine967-C5)-methyltransferase